MVSRLEDALLRFTKPKSAFRERFFELLNDGITLRRLRATSRVLRDLVDHNPARLFSSLYITAPLTLHHHPESLELVLQFCQTLTITVAAEKRDSGRTSWKFIDVPVTPRPRKVLARNSKYEWRQSSDSNVNHIRTARASVPPTQLPIQLQYLRHAVRWQWADIFSRCHDLQSLTLRINGDPAWPGRTSVEDALVDVRAALEQADVPNLTEVHLTPVHAMGIIHLRWNGINAFGPPLLSIDHAPQIWARIETLDLQLTSPFIKDRLTETQQPMFKKVLYDYLRNFAPTLRSLRFIWLDGEGPSPLTLHLEEDLGHREPLSWFRLEELWVGNVSLPRRAIDLATELAPKLEILAMLRSTQRDSCMDLTDPNVWIHVHLGKQNSDPSTWADSASSVYSQSIRSSFAPSLLSTTSRVVPFMLDVTGRGSKKPWLAGPDQSSWGRR